MIVEERHDVCGRSDVHDPHVWQYEGHQCRCPGLRERYTGGGFLANFIGHCCRCDRPIRKRQAVIAHGHGFIHVTCAQRSER